MATDTLRFQEADYDLDGLETLAWDLLAKGAQSGRDAFHTGVLCSLSDDDFPSSRTMVLRQIDPEQRLLASYGDVRAPKVRTLERFPKVSWVFYDARRRVELRATGKMRVYTGPGNALAESVWASMTNIAQHAYSRTEVGGQPLAERAPDTTSATADEMTAQRARGFGNFALLLTFVERLEFLFLNHTGHHRARFLYQGDTLVERHWIST